MKDLIIMVLLRNYLGESGITDYPKKDNINIEIIFLSSFLLMFMFIGFYYGVESPFLNAIFSGSISFGKRIGIWYHSNGRDCS